MLAYSEEFSTYRAAHLRECQIKGWSRAKKEALMRGDMDKLRLLARRRH